MIEECSTVFDIRRRGKQLVHRHVNRVKTLDGSNIEAWHVGARSVFI